MNPHDEAWSRRRCLVVGSAWCVAAGLPGCGGRLSDNAFLESLAVSSGALEPAFSQSVFSYKVAVKNAVTSVNFTPRTADDGASVEVEGSRVDDGDTSPNFALAVGENEFDIVVTADDRDTQQTYVVVVTRSGDVPSDASLIGLLVSSGSLSPAFSDVVTRYTLVVANSVSTIQFTPTSGNDQSSITVAGVAVPTGGQSPTVSLAVGSNQISIVVVSDDRSTTRTYTIDVTRAA